MHSTNLTVNSSFVLAKCIDFVTTLSNYSGNISEISFQSSGIDFVHVGNNKHVPILVNETLFKFLQTLWTVGSLIFLLLTVVIFLSWCNNFLKWFCPAQPEPLHFRETHQHSPIVRRTNRNGELIELNCRKATLPFIASYFLKPVLTQDNFFRVKPFFPKTNTLSPSGVYLEITPKVHCPNINCLPANCESQHVFHLWIPCEIRTASIEQPILIYPTDPHPVPLETAVKFK